MIIWVAVSVLAAGGLGFVIYNLVNKDSGDGDNGDDDDEESDGGSSGVGKFGGKSGTGNKVYTKFADTNIRTSAEVNNYPIINNKIGDPLAPNVLVGKKISETVGDDNYTWYQVELAPLPELDGKKTGWIRSDVATLK